MPTLEQTTSSRFPHLCRFISLDPKAYNSPTQINQKIGEKKRLRRLWHRLRTPESKTLLNAARQDLKELLNNNKNGCIQIFLKSLTPRDSTEATEKLKQVKGTYTPIRTQQETWARTNEEKNKLLQNT
jgi:hypothetical protein